MDKKKREKLFPIIVRGFWGFPYQKSSAQCGFTILLHQKKNY
jgi:hypothetical protein